MTKNKNEFVVTTEDLLNLIKDLVDDSDFWYSECNLYDGHIKHAIDHNKLIRKARELL
jgi:hypothetical protein